MNTAKNYIILLVGLGIIASVGSTYAVIQATTLPTSGIQSDSMKAMGHATLVLYGADGAVKAYRQTDNLIVNNGDNATVSAMFGAHVRHTTNYNVGTFNAVQVGTGVTAATTADSTLGTAQTHKIIGVISNATATHGNIVLTTTFNPGKITNSTAASITEAGIFDNTAANLGSNSTNMYARQVFTAISVGSADTLTITWTVNIT